MSVSYDPSDPNSTQTDPTNLIGQPAPAPAPFDQFTDRPQQITPDPTDQIGQAAAAEPTDTSKKSTYDPSNPDSSVTDQIGQPARTAPATDPTDQIGQPATGPYKGADTYVSPRAYNDTFGGDDGSPLPFPDVENQLQQTKAAEDYPKGRVVGPNDYNNYFNKSEFGLFRNVDRQNDVFPVNQMTDEARARMAYDQPHGTYVSPDDYNAYDAGTYSPWRMEDAASNGGLPPAIDAGTLRNYWSVEGRAGDPHWGIGSGIPLNTDRINMYDPSQRAATQEFYAQQGIQQNFADAIATDQSNLNQAANPITSDPTDAIGQPASGPDVNRGEQSASLTGGYSPPAYVNRAERPEIQPVGPTTGETIDESSRLANTGAAVFTAKNDAAEQVRQQVSGEITNEANSLHGEQLDLYQKTDDLNQRWSDYVDAVNGGQQARDPQFEASIQGESAALQQTSDSLQSRIDAFRNRDPSFYDDRFAGVNNTPGVSRAMQDYTNTIGSVNTAAQTRQSLTGNTAFGLAPDQTPPYLSAQAGQRIGANLLAATSPGLNASFTETQASLKQFGPVDNPIAYYQVQAAPGQYGGDWIPIGTNTGQQAYVQQRANLPDNNPDKVRVVSAATAGVSIPSQTSFVNQPVTGLEQLSNIAAIGPIAAIPLTASLITGTAPIAAGAVAASLGGAYLFRGTGPTLGSTMFIEQGLAGLAKIPGAGGLAEFLSNVKIPDVAQHPLAIAEQSWQEFLHNPIEQAYGPLGLAVATLNNALGVSSGNTNTLSWDNVKGLYTEPAAVYAERQGLNRAGAEYLFTSAVALHDPRNGVMAALTGGDPVGKFHDVFTQGLALYPNDPQAAADYAFNKTNNGVAAVLHQSDLLNPLWFALDTPSLNALLGEIVKTAAIPLGHIPGMSAVGDFFTQVSALSGARMKVADHQVDIGTQIGRPEFAGEAGARLLEIGQAFRGGNDQLAKSLAQDYANVFGTTPEWALSNGTRAYMGIELDLATKAASDQLAKTPLTEADRYMAKTFSPPTQAGGRAVSTAPVIDASNYVQSIIDDFRSGNFSNQATRDVSYGLGLRRPEDIAKVQQEAVIRQLASFMRPQVYQEAGLNLAAMATRGGWQRTISFGADALRTMMLLPTAIDLALRKIPDEALRAAIKGVSGDFLGMGGAASDMLLFRALARGMERTTGPASTLGRALENQSTIRQYAERGIPFGKELYRTPSAPRGTGFLGLPTATDAMNARAPWSPFRATDKFLDATVQSPTSHVRQNAAREALKAWDAAQPGRAASFAQNIRDSFQGLPIDGAAKYREAYQTVIGAKSPQDFADLANRYLGEQQRLSPNVPTNNRAMGSPSGGPSARVQQDIARTGGTPGLVSDATNARFTNPMATPQEPFAYRPRQDAGPASARPHEWADAVLGGKGAGFTVPQDVRAAAREMGIPYQGEAPNDFAQKIRDSQPRPAAPGDGSAPKVGGFNQPAPDIAAGYGDGGSIGAARGRSPAQSALDQAARPYRDAIHDTLRAGGTLDDRAALLDRINPGESTSAAGKAWDDRVMLEQRAVKSELGRTDLNAHELAELTSHERALADLRAPGNPDYAARSKTYNEPRFGPSQDVTDQIGQPAAAAAGVPPNGTAPPHVTDTIGQPQGDAALAAGYGRATGVARQGGVEFGQAQAAQSRAGTARGNSIIGNFDQQTRWGELVKTGQINGKQVFLPIVPFAPFHIHTTQFWAGYFLEHPAVPFAIARLLNTIGFDDYGATKINNRYVQGLLGLSTAAKLVDWAQATYRYATDAIAHPNGNNPLQTAAKIGYRALTSYVAPFEYIGGPAQAALQSATNPMLTAKGQVDPRELMKERGSGTAFGAVGQLANTATGSRLPRSVVQGITDPGQIVTNQMQRASVAGVNALGGTANIKQYNPDSGIPYMADAFAAQQGWSPNQARAAVTDAKTGQPVTADGRALLAEYNHQQDLQNLQKFSPVRVGAPEGKPIYPSDNPQPFFQARAAGEGDTHYVGARLQNGQVISTTPDEARRLTAEAQLHLSPSLQTAPYADYARDYLGQVGTSNRPNEIVSLEMQRADRLQASIDANAKRFGAGLPQDQRTAMLSTVGTELAPGFSTYDLIHQPGNVIDLERQYAQAKAAGASKEALKAIGDRINDAQTKDIAQFPGTKAYFDMQDAARGYVKGEPSPYAGWTQNQKDAHDAFTNLVASVDYQRLKALEDQQAASGPYKSAGELAWYKANRVELTNLQNIRNAAEQSIVDRFGVNPKDLANQVAIAAGRAAPYADTTIKGQTTQTGPGGSSSTGGSPRSPRTSSGSYGSGSSGKSSGSGNTSTSANQAGTQFFDLYRSLTTQEKAIVHEALRASGANVIGQKGTTAAQFERALTVAQDALAKKTTAAGATGGGFQALRSVPMSLADAQLLARGIVPTDYWSQLRGGVPGAPAGAGYPSYGETSSNLRTTQSNSTRNQPTSNVRTFTPTRPASLPGSKSKGRPPAA